MTAQDSEAAFRQALLTSPGERQEVDYKAAEPFSNSTDFGLKLIKHILGMANTGGGSIVIGFDDDTLRPDPNLTKEVTATYDTTQLSAAVERITQGTQPIRLVVFKEVHPETQMIHPIFHVRGFERTPFVCRSTKGGANSKRPILEQGKVYIRRPGAATSELHSLADWEELLSRMTSGNSVESKDATTLFDEFRAEQWHRAGTRNRFEPGYGFIETAHMLTRPGMPRWSHRDLQKAIVTSGLHPGSNLVAKQGGVEICVGWPGSRLEREYRYLDRAGSYYSLATFTEDYEQPSFNSSMGHPDSMLWLDFAIQRIVETLLNSVRLYEALGVGPDESYLLSIRHGGLRARSLYASSLRNSLYFHVVHRRTSQEDAHLWQREVTQDFIKSQYMELKGR